MWWGMALLAASLLLPASANAGHLFTQAGANTPIALNAGQGLQVTQVGFEDNSSGGQNGFVSLNFAGGADATAWSANDAVQITIGQWTATYTFGQVGAGSSGTSFTFQDPTLAAANIVPSANTTFTVIATAGQFTWTGYRIYVTQGTNIPITYNGTPNGNNVWTPANGNGDTFHGVGAGPINQQQVVNANQLGGGGLFQPVANSPEKGLGGVLDGLSGATGQMGAVLTLMGAMTEDSQRLAMQLISPNRSQAIGQAATSTATTALDTVQVRLDALRLGIGADSSFRTSFDGHGNNGNQPAQTGMASGDEALNKSFWIKAFGGKANQDARGGFAGSDSDVYGMMAGIDRQTESGWLVGAAMAYAKTNVNMSDFRDGDGADIKTYQLTGYVARNFDRWYLQGMMSYAYNDYETNRNTHLTGMAKADFNGDMYAMRVIAGMPFTLRENVTLTPSVGVEALRIEQSSYTEQGAGVLSLNVGDSDANRVRSLLGLELATQKQLNDGSVLRPSVKANWRHEFKDEGMGTTASLVGGGGTFETTGQKVNRDVFGLTGRLNWEKTDRVGIAVELGAERGAGYYGFNGQVVGTYRF